MNKKFRSLGLALVALTAIAAASADAPKTTTSTSAAKPAAQAPTPKVVKCAITGETIGAPSTAAGFSVYKGHTYYFCCPSCKPEFDANPAKYAKPAYAYPLAPKAVAKPATTKA